MLNLSDSLSHFGNNQLQPEGDDLSHQSTIKLKKRLSILSVLLGLGLSCWGLVRLTQVSKTQVCPVTPELKGTEVLEETADSSATESAHTSFSSTVASIWVDVSGAVNKPGVYRLRLGDRRVAAIDQAGGLAQRADKQKVNQELNLAARLVDGEKIYIPFAGEKSSQDNLSRDSQPDSNPAQAISLNSASKTELESLNGIGEVRAQQIVDNRPYSRVLEVVEKGVLSESLFNKIKDKLSL